MYEIYRKYYRRVCAILIFPNHNEKVYEEVVVKDQILLTALKIIIIKLITFTYSMVRIQKRISDGLDVLQYFTTREWIFHNTNLLTLWGDMSSKDKLLFPIDFLNIDVMEYIKNVILGARQYCMKENLSTLPRARLHQRM